MRLVGYVRVSREDENPMNQRYAILQWANRAGHQVVDFYEDIGVSGALPPAQRPGFSAALRALEGADGLVVSALDRVARSLRELVEAVRAVEERGKVIMSVREEWLQTVDPRVRQLIIAILGWAAEMEREFIRERTREALMRAKAMGKRIGGRPKVTNEMIEAAIKMVEKGVPLKHVARMMRVGYSTLASAITRNPIYRTMYYEARARAIAARGGQKRS